MTVGGISLNGIDPDGNNPPDEILHHPEDGDATELVRRPGGWEVRVYSDGDLEYDMAFEGFTEAFAYFAEMVGVEADDV